MIQTAAPDSKNLAGVVYYHMEHKPSPMRMRIMDPEYEACEEGSKMSATTDLITTLPTREQSSDDTDTCASDHHYRRTQPGTILL